MPREQGASRLQEQVRCAELQAHERVRECPLLKAQARQEPLSDHREARSVT
jgi:hypothetical protein